MLVQTKEAEIKKGVTLISVSSMMRKRVRGSQNDDDDEVERMGIGETRGK